MNEEKLIELFEDESYTAEWKGDNALQGLIILQKYAEEDKDILCGADHDIIYSLYVSEVADKITEEDANALRKLNWMIQDEYFACFVSLY